jgi:hypothetical protein
MERSYHDDSWHVISNNDLNSGIGRIQTLFVNTPIEELLPEELIHTGIAIYPIRTTNVGKWTPSGTVLTVPDLEDSVEQMLARRQSGIESFNLRNQIVSSRPYPADPTSVETAADVLSKIKTQAETELKQKQDSVKQAQQTALKNAKAQQKQTEEFEAWKASQENMTRAK